MSRIRRPLVPACLCAALIPVPAGAADRWAPDVGTVLDYDLRMELPPGAGPPGLSIGTLRKTVTANDGIHAGYSNVLRIGPWPSGIPAFVYAGTSDFDLYLAAESRLAHLNPTRVTLNALRCGEADLRTLLPLGTVPAITVPCTAVTDIPPDGRREATVPVTVTFAGRAAVTVPAGTFATVAVRFSFTSGTVTTTNQAEFDPETGVIVRQTTEVSGSPAPSTLTITLTGVTNPP